MAILDVITAPAPVLRQKALPVEFVDKDIQILMNDMLETMYDDGGIGLAANQVGVLKRVVVLDLKTSDEKERPEGFYPLYIANPEILELSQEMVEAEEGCLSVPDQSVMVSRPNSIKIKYLDYNNKEQELETDGWLARALQHEFDHLNGKLLIDYLSNLKKNIVIRKLTKLKKQLA